MFVQDLTGELLSTSMYFYCMTERAGIFILHTMYMGRVFNKINCIVKWCLGCHRDYLRPGRSWGE